MNYLLYLRGNCAKKLNILFSFFFQARFQAQQMAEKEEKLINLLEHRQDEAIRRIAYNGRDSANSHSANSLSSNNSSNSLGPSVTAIQGRPPGRVRQMFEERRRVEPVGNGSSHVTSPVGWDKSYPLKPVVNGNNGAGLYKRNSTLNLGNKPNKYSGNYGPKSRSSSVNRAVSMDRSRGYAPSNESGYSSSSMARTRSHHQLSHHSSGEDSYGSSSRPPSRGGMPPSSAHNYATYGGRSGRSRSSYNAHDYQDEEYSPPGSRKASYTHEYVRNLPPTATSTTPRGRMARSGRNRDSSPSMRGSYDHSSYSSQSSDKSDPYMPTSKSHQQLGSAYGGHGHNNNLTHIPGPTARSNSRSRLHSNTFRLVLWKLVLRLLRKRRWRMFVVPQLLPATSLLILSFHSRSLALEFLTSSAFS